MFEIPWDDGTSDKIYLDTTNLPTSKVIQVTSDNNLTKLVRDKVIVFKSQNLNTEPICLIITQVGDKLSLTYNKQHP